ncbi:MULTISPECIES: helix-turn-helix domain-containing protein [Arcicella]|uniref:Helix-turn-helix transcriptional regulator n=2 Tax=Arcicella TaxID=217140 RepID=A0ABU5SDI1_9BACT|nr:MULTISPECIES: helix-turn-helix transcriptional regulator [unclassified Arcicella]MEA5402663.1 helix-turn-helix transcriptional regulator [Arcicella sp. DC2W]MEA5425339.1 helix-turn-helix transcriptional regulator [Arcicella sp. DC25W]
MSKYPIGLIIKDLIAEKNLSISIIANQLGISRQAIYQSFNRKTMDKEDIEKWAKALETTSEVILSKIDGKKEDNEENNYLLQILERIEKQMTEQSEQLRRKDEQISQLLQTNNALVMNSLKKDEPAPNSPSTTGKIVVLFPEFEKKILANC